MSLPGFAGGGVNLGSNQHHTWQDEDVGCMELTNGVLKDVQRAFLTP